MKMYIFIDLPKIVWNLKKLKKKIKFVIGDPSCFEARDPGNPAILLLDISQFL